MFRQEKYVCLVLTDEMTKKIFLSNLVFVLKEDVNVPV